MVTYVRGSRPLDVSATVGKTIFEVDDGYGVLVRHESRDFLVLAADLVLDGQRRAPSGRPHSRDAGAARRSSTR